MSYSTRDFCIALPGTIITGANTPLDVRTAAVPAGITRWIPTRIEAYCENTGNSLAAATLGFWTAAGGVGTNLLSVASGTLTNMTTTGAYQSFSVATPTAVYTSTGIVLRQNIAAASTATGSVNVLLYISAFA